MPPTPVSIGVIREKLRQWKGLAQSNQSVIEPSHHFRVFFQAHNADAPIQIGEDEFDHADQPGIYVLFLRKNWDDLSEQPADDNPYDQLDGWAKHTAIIRDESETRSTRDDPITIARRLLGMQQESVEFIHKQLADTRKLLDEKTEECKALRDRIAELEQEIIELCDDENDQFFEIIERLIKTVQEETGYSIEDVVVIVQKATTDEQIKNRLKELGIKSPKLLGE